MTDGSVRVKVRNKVKKTRAEVFGFFPELFYKYLGRVKRTKGSLMFNFDEDTGNIFRHY